MSASEFYQIFSGIGDAYRKGLDEYEKKQTLADLGRSLADNDYNRSAQLAIKAGSLDAGVNLLKLGQAATQRAALTGLLNDPAGGGGNLPSLSSLGQPFPQAPAQQAINRVSPSASEDLVGRTMGAVSGIESGGNYGALGPVTKTGDRAYGKYQVMGANIGPWSQEVLGRPVSQQEFISNPQLQDAIVRGKMGQYVQKYGSEGAMRAWFAGERGMNNPNARDQLGTSVSAYSRMGMANMGMPAAQPAQPRLPAGQTGGATAYTSTGQPVATDADGNAIQPMAVAAQAQPAQAPAPTPQLPPAPYGNLNGPQAPMPDWKGMPAPAFAPQQQQAPSPASMAPQRIPQPMQQAQPQPQQVAQMQQPAAYQQNAQETAQRQQLIQYRAKLISAMPGLDEGSRAAVRARIDDVNARIGDLDKEKWQDVRPEDYRNIPGLDPNYRGVVQRGRNGEIRFPGKPATEVNMKTENAFDQEMGKGAAKLMLDIQQDGRNSTKAINVLRVMDKLTENPNFYSGTGGQAMTSFKKAAVAMGLAKSEEAAPNELFNALSNRVTLDGLGGSLGTAISNADRDFIQQTQGNIGNTPEGNRALIRMNIALEKRKQDVAKFASDYAKARGGRLDYGFDSALADWSEANPLLSEAERKAIAGATTGGGQQSGQVPGRSSAPVRINSPADATNLPKGTRIIIPKFDSATGKAIGEEVGVVP